MDPPGDPSVHPTTPSGCPPTSISERLLGRPGRMGGMGGEKGPAGEGLVRCRNILGENQFTAGETVRCLIIMGSAPPLQSALGCDARCLPSHPPTHPPTHPPVREFTFWLYLFCLLIAMGAGLAVLGPLLPYMDTLSLDSTPSSAEPRRTRPQEAIQRMVVLWISLFGRLACPEQATPSPSWTSKSI